MNVDGIDDLPADWDTFYWIASAPTTTPEEWQAKMLAYAAWDRDAYDDNPAECTPASTFRATLLRDIAGPSRNAIIRRCTAKYGPLPPTYTAEGVWTGPDPAQVAAARKRIRRAMRKTRQ